MEEAHKLFVSAVGTSCPEAAKNAAREWASHMNNPGVEHWSKGHGKAMNVLLSSLEAEYTIIVSMAEVKAIDLWRCYSYDHADTDSRRVLGGPYRLYFLVKNQQAGVE
eukprot:scaffold339811_cov55-Attheya_sp.AAC.1